MPARSGSRSTLDPTKLLAEFLGTALLVLFGVGTATVMFGFGLTGSDQAAGVVATALAFGLVLLALAYVVGPVSGCHVNPAVTLGFVVSRRISLTEAAGYWTAQVAGGVIGAGVLWVVLRSAAGYSDDVGLGANGYGSHSMIGLGAGGALVMEILLTFAFVLTVLVVTRKNAWPQVAGVAVGFALVLVHLLGIPLTGTSVNPARSLGSAIFAGGDAMAQLWVFLLAPLVGGALAAVVAGFLYRAEVAPPEDTAAAPQVATQTPPRRA